MYIPSTLPFALWKKDRYQCSLVYSRASLNLVTFLKIAKLLTLSQFIRKRVRDRIQPTTDLSPSRQYHVKLWNL